MTEEKTWRAKTDHERQIVAAKYAYVAGLIEYDGATEEELRAQRKELRAEFTQLIEDVRAEAWDEGVAVALDHAILNPDGITLRLEHLDGRPWTNPHRKDTA